jgi:hypothetical protein
LLLRAWVSSPCQTHETEADRAYFLSIDWGHGVGKEMLVDQYFKIKTDMKLLLRPI